MTETLQTTNRQILIQRGQDLVVMPGRRSFFTYRDLGVTDTTNGFMRVQVVNCKDGFQGETGWHYHPGEGLWFQIRSGWGEIQLEDGQECRLNAGDSGFIPSGYRHNEIGTSPDFEYMEVSVPAELVTVPCDIPEGWAQRAEKLPPNISIKG